MFKIAIGTNEWVQYTLDYTRWKIWLTAVASNSNMRTLWQIVSSIFATDSWSTDLASQVPQPTQEVTFMAVGDPDYDLAH